MLCIERDVSIRYKTKDILPTDKLIKNWTYIKFNMYIINTKLDINDINVSFLYLTRLYKAPSQRTKEDKRGHFDLVLPPCGCDPKLPTSPVKKIPPSRYWESGIEWTDAMDRRLCSSHFKTYLVACRRLKCSSLRIMQTQRPLRCV